MSDPDKIRYQAVVTDGGSNNAYSLIASQLQRQGTGLHVLEVGCSSGYMGKYLIERGHRVTGIEPHPPAAEAARQVLNDVFMGGFEAFMDERGTRERFDVVMFGDVLEHLVDPPAALRNATSLLKEGGVITFSIPNVTHGSVRAMLLEGEWTYRELGILDATHLRFFSRASLIALCSSSQLRIVSFARTIIDASELNRGSKLGLRDDSLLLARTFAKDADFDSFQFIGTVVPCASVELATEHNRAWLHADLGSLPQRRRSDWVRWRDGVRTKFRVWRSLMNR